MTRDDKRIQLLLVDDEEEFRSATARVLERRGFEVDEAPSGEQALARVTAKPPDVMLLDLKMEGMDGITTLQRIREVEPELPVIILTGHGSYQDAVAGIGLAIVDFLQKPVDVELLAERIRDLLQRQAPAVLREPRVAELMVVASSYARVYEDEPLAAVVHALAASFAHRVSGKVSEQGHRTVIVYDRSEQFVGLARISDVVELCIPQFLRDSPYASFFTGMFLAQCKTLGHRTVAEVVRDLPSITEQTPLMEAAHLIVSQRLINLPVLRDGRLVGIVRDKDLLLEIGRHLAPPRRA